MHKCSRHSTHITLHEPYADRDASCSHIYICKTLLVLFHLLICAYMKTSIIMQICYEFTNYLWGEMTARGVIQSFIHSIITAIAIIVDELWTENRMQPQCAVATLCIARYTVENACALECAWARSHTQDVDEERSHKAVRVHDAVIARRAQTHTHSCSDIGKPYKCTESHARFNESVL